MKTAIRLFIITLIIVTLLACGCGSSDTTPQAASDPAAASPDPVPSAPPAITGPDEPNPTYAAPYISAPDFQSVLDQSKLQAPTSSTLIAQGNFNRDDAYNDYFYSLSDKPNEVVFSATGLSNRSELRQMNEWYTHQNYNAMAGHFYLQNPLAINVDQLTVMQIHDSESLNKPLLRVVWMRAKNDATDHLWAVLKDDTEVAGQYSWIALGPRADAGNRVSVAVANNLISIAIDGQTIINNRAVDYWKNLSSYFKAGLYLQSEGSASVHFTELSYSNAAALSADLPPSGNFNLDQWKLTLPFSKTHYFGSGGDTAAEIKPFNLNPDGFAPLNDGFVDTTTFTTAADGAMQFIVDLTDSRIASTANSSYARSELRELYQWQAGESESLANWPAAGNHTLEATVSVSEYFAGDPQVVVGQIHAKDSSRALVKLQWDGPDKPVRAIINQDPVSGNPISLYFETVGLNQFSYRIQLLDGEMTISVNDNNTQSVRFGEAGMSSVWHDHSYYFKAGNYAQALIGSNGRFAVNIYRLVASHR